VDAACTAYTTATEAKRSSTPKDRRQGELDAYGDKVFALYEKRINDLLQVFGAGFPSETKRAKSAAWPVPLSHSHQHVPVALGDAATPAEEASFKNT